MRVQPGVRRGQRGQKLMVEFQFLFNEQILLDDISDILTDQSQSIFWETFFIFPVRININGTELFKHTKNIKVMVGSGSGHSIEVQTKAIEDIWLELPILHFISNGLKEVVLSNDGTKAIYSLPGSGASLIFTPNNADIEIFSTINGAKVSIDSHELVNAFQEFRKSTIERFAPFFDKNSEFLNFSQQC